MTKAEIKRLMHKWASKGGRASAKKLREGRTAEQIAETMRAVANARWAKVRDAKKAEAAA